MFSWHFSMYVCNTFRCIQLFTISECWGNIILLVSQCWLMVFWFYDIGVVKPWKYIIKLRLFKSLDTEYITDAIFIPKVFLFNIFCNYRTYYSNIIFHSKECSQFSAFLKNLKLFSHALTLINLSVNTRNITILEIMVNLSIN